MRVRNFLEVKLRFAAIGLLVAMASFFVMMMCPTPALAETPTGPSGVVSYVRVGASYIYINQDYPWFSWVDDDSGVPNNGYVSKAPSGVSFDPKTNTLTLANYKARTSESYPVQDSDQVFKDCHIYIGGDGNAKVTVLLKGTNTLTDSYKRTQVDKPYFIGSDCNLVVKGGTLKTSKCNGIASAKNISIKSGTLRINQCGTWGGALLAENGNVSISKAAKLYLIGADKEGGDELIDAKKCTNSYTSFKKLWGTLCYGATFKAVRVDAMGYKLNCGIFQVSTKPGEAYSIRAVRETGAEMTGFQYISRLTCTTYTPYITGCTSNAFKIGSKAAKVKTVLLSNKVNAIGKQAFKPLKKLKKIIIPCGPKSSFLYCNGSAVKSKAGSEMSKKAFSGVSKRATIEIQYYNKKKMSKSRIAAKCKKVLRSYGLPASVKVKVVFKTPLV